MARPVPRTRCPAHNGNSEDSLSIKEGDDGRAILFCHAGCELRDIVETLGLGVVDLFVHDGRNTGAAKKASAGSREVLGNEL